MKSLGLLALVMLFSMGSQAMSPEAVKLNKQGIEQLEKENPYLAYKYFLQALSIEPFSPQLKLNLGLSFEANEDFDKAYKEYLGALKYSKSPELKFMALFNAAEVQGKQKNIGVALKHYQEALELNPESIEVKTNIELLLQQGQGGGKGDQQEQKDDKQGQNNEKQEPNDKGPPQDKPKKPKPFDSKQLTKDDVRKILEELKNQEQKIREKEYGKQRKERPNDKDW